MRAARLLAASAAAAALVAAAVAGAGRRPQRRHRPTAPPKITGTITVSAAASLTDVFPVIARAFMKKYPGTTVKFNFGGSSALVEQINAGAPVDVLATASEPTMWKAVNAGHAGVPLLFAKNTMAIAMPPGNPKGIRSLSDLHRPRGAGRGVRGAGPLRSGRSRPVQGQRPHGHAGHPGTRRARGARQGHGRRGRRGHRLRH